MRALNKMVALGLVDLTNRWYYLTEYGRAVREPEERATQRTQAEAKAARRKTYEPLLGTMPDSDIARMFGCWPPEIMNARLDLKIPKFVNEAARKRREAEDACLAEQVRKRRRQRQILSAPDIVMEPFQSRFARSVSPCLIGPNRRPRGPYIPGNEDDSLYTVRDDD